MHHFWTLLVGHHPFKTRSLLKLKPLDTPTHYRLVVRLISKNTPATWVGVSIFKTTPLDWLTGKNPKSYVSWYVRIFSPKDNTPPIFLPLYHNFLTFEKQQSYTYDPLTYQHQGTRQTESIYTQNFPALALQVIRLLGLWGQTSDVCQPTFFSIITLTREL